MVFDESNECMPKVHLPPLYRADPRDDAVQRKNPDMLEPFPASTAESAISDSAGGRAAPPIASPSFRSDGAEKLGAYLSRELGLRHCRVTGGGSPFQAEARSASFASSKFVTLECDGDLRMETQGDSVQIVWLPMCGTARFQLGREAVTCVPGTACIWPVRTEVRMLAGPSHRAIVIQVSREQLILRLARMLGRPPRDPLSFEPWKTFDGPEHSVLQLVQFIIENLERESSVLARSRALTSSTEALLLDMLLVAWPNNYSSAIAALASAPLPKHLKAVVAAIEADPAQPWTIRRMSDLSEVSARTLCDNFSRFRGCTARQFLQSVRLARFRKDLLESRGGASVSVIARKWGFKHPGRLAGMYRKVYGEAPSDTLRRPRSCT